MKKDNYVGLNTSEIDWSTIETEAEALVSEDNLNDEVLNLAEIMPSAKHDVTLNFDDVKSIYKFSCLNEIFKSKSSSKDRLRSVQGLSGFPGIDACANENGSFLSLEDPVVCTSYGIILGNIIERLNPMCQLLIFLYH